MLKPGWIAAALGVALLVPEARAAQDPDFDRIVPDVVERVTPAVVSIKSRRKIGRSPFDDFFFGGSRGGREREAQGLGSGVIVRSDGTILTNNHVVEGADTLTVELSDGREFEGKLVGRDEKTDVAVIRIGEKGLPTLPFGDSSLMRVGQTVLAIGNPMGVGLTVSQGIISARGRSGMGIVDYEEFLQTDAAINPGNSGGALVSLKGELIGINTAIMSRTGGFQGIGFAIPSNMARQVMDQLIQNGVVRRGQMGVVIQDLTPELSKAMGAGAPGRGILISQVVEGSPAERAGLKRGDVVVKLDGNAVASTSELRNSVSLHGPGAKVDLEIWRDGKTRSYSIQLGDLDRKAGAGEPPGLEGLEVTPATPQLLGSAGLPEDARGLIVTSIDPRGSLGWAGLRKGDLVVEVNRRPVETLEEMGREVSRGGETLLLTIRRPDGMLYVAVTR